MAAINICSDFGAQKNKVSLCFHSFPIYLPWSNGTPWNASSFLDITEHSQGTEWRFEPILFTFYRMLEPRCLVLFHEALESKVYNESESEVTQSCLTLCDRMNCSLPGSSVHGISQARTLEWVAISFSNAGKWKVKVKPLSRARLLPTPWAAAYQAPPSMGFSRQEYWSGVPLPSKTSCLQPLIGFSP